METLKKKKDFDSVFKEGKGCQGDLLFLKVARNQKGFNRIAFSVSQKIAKKAVSRNRMRRMMRQAMLDLSEDIEKGLDMVFVARTAFEKEKSQRVREEIKELLKKVGIYKDKTNKK